MMTEPKVVKASDVEWIPIEFGGKEGDAGTWVTLFGGPLAQCKDLSKGIIMGVCRVNPGYAAHRWHGHEIDAVTEAAKPFDIVYPGGFEEIYHIASGTGLAQWKTKDGEVREEKVGAGDTVFFPRDTTKHQVVATGTEQMIVVFMGAPADFEFKKRD
jgi:mannose-6-phosphate isomerase-like protein (cupin superfamily)